jgi:hypothetical protein
LRVRERERARERRGGGKMSLEKLRPFNATKFGILEMNIWELYPEIK